MTQCSPKRHPLSLASKAGALPPHWPSYTGQSQFVGTSGRVTVWVDPVLGAQGHKNAQDLLADIPRIIAFDDSIFGTQSGKVQVIVFALGGQTDGTGGADHMGCDYLTGQNIEVCAAFGRSARVSALFEAELSECDMGGNLCGYSTGEALSRWCAMQVSNNALGDFASAPVWAQAGMPNWVDQTEPTDQSYPSTGCGMAFISWLISKGYSLATIARQMVALGDSGTFAQLYASLSALHGPSPWPRFLADIKVLPSGVINDDPFGGSTPPPPPPPPPAVPQITLSQPLAAGTYKLTPA